jgi:hypothetical protein
MSTTIIIPITVRVPVKVHVDHENGVPSDVTIEVIDFNKAIYDINRIGDDALDYLTEEYYKNK